MEFNIDINMDNAAFEYAPGVEIARILHKVGEQLEAGYVEGKIRDVNGNSVGRFEVIV